MASCESIGRELSFEWSHHRISSIDSKVRITLQNPIKHSGSEKVKACGSLHMWVVYVWNKRCQLSSLAASGWIMRRNQRWDRTSACSGALGSRSSPCLVSPHPPRSMTAQNAKPWPSSFFFSSNDNGSLTSPSNCYERMKETRPMP